MVRLGDVAEVNARSWDPSEGNNILYLDLTAVVVPGVLAPPRDLTAIDAPSRARRRVQAGDILISTVRPNLRGFARVTDAPKNLIASTGFAVVTPKSIVSNSILYNHVMTDQFAIGLRSVLLAKHIRQLDQLMLPTSGLLPHHCQSSGPSPRCWTVQNMLSSEGAKNGMAYNL